jgi:hypothetical protein
LPASTRAPRWNKRERHYRKSALVFILGLSLRSREALSLCMSFDARRGRLSHAGPRERHFFGTLVVAQAEINGLA